MITVANTAVPTVSAICQVGATPIFCDVDPATALIDIAQISPLQTRKTKAVLPVHLFGNVVDIREIRRHLRPDVWIIEDCAQAHGATLDGQHVGNQGDAAAFSFYPTKNLGAFGDAGYCTSPHPAVIDKMRVVHNLGMDSRGIAVSQGVNARMDELQAALLRVKLPLLGGYIQRRQSIAALYARTLPDDLKLGVAPNVQASYHQYVVKIPNRDLIKSLLLDEGIQTKVHYPVPIHQMEPFKSYARHLPHTEDLCAKILSLPAFPEITDAEVDRVCRALSSALECSP